MSACLPQAMTRKIDGTDQNGRVQNNNIPRGQVVEWASEVERRSIIQKNVLSQILERVLLEKIFYKKLQKRYSPYLNILLFFIHIYFSYNALRRVRW